MRRGGGRRTIVLAGVALFLMLLLMLFVMPSGNVETIPHPSTTEVVFKDPRTALTEGPMELETIPQAARTKPKPLPTGAALPITEAEPETPAGTESTEEEETTTVGRTSATTQESAKEVALTSAATTTAVPPPSNPTRLSQISPSDLSVSLVITPSADHEDGTATCMCFAAHSASKLGEDAAMIGNVADLQHLASSLLDRHNRRRQIIEPAARIDQPGTLGTSRVPRSVYPIVEQTLRKEVLRSADLLSADAARSPHPKLVPRFVSYRLPSDTFHSPIADMGNYNLDQGSTRYGGYLRGVFDTCVVWVANTSATAKPDVAGESANKVAPNPSVLRELGLPYYLQRDYRGEIVPNCFEREVSLGRVVGQFWGAVRSLYGTYDGLSADAIAAGSGAVGSVSLRDGGSFKPNFNLPYVFLEELAEGSVTDYSQQRHPQDHGPKDPVLTSPTLKTRAPNTNQAGSLCRCSTFGVVLRGGKLDAMVHDEEKPREAAAEKAAHLGGSIATAPAPLPQGVLLVPPQGSHRKVAVDAHTQTDDSTKLRLAIRKSFEGVVAECIPGVNPSAVPLDKVPVLLECIQGARGGFATVMEGLHATPDMTLFEHISLEVVDNDGFAQNGTSAERPSTFAAATLPGHTVNGWAEVVKGSQPLKFVVPMPHGVVADGFAPSVHSTQHIVPLHSRARDILASLPRVGTVLGALAPAATPTTNGKLHAGMIDYDDVVLRGVLSQRQHAFAHICEGCVEGSAHIDASSVVIHAERFGWATASVFAAAGEDGTLFNLSLYYLVGPSNATINLKDAPTMRLIVDEAYLHMYPRSTTTVPPSNPTKESAQVPSSLPEVSAVVNAIRKSPAVNRYVTTQMAAANQVSTVALRYAEDVLDAMLKAISKAAEANPSVVPQSNPAAAADARAALLGRWKKAIKWVTHVYLPTPFGEVAMLRYLLGRIRREFDEARLNVSHDLATSSPNDERTVHKTDEDDVLVPSTLESLPLPVLLRIYMQDQYHKGILEVPTEAEWAAVEGAIALPKSPLASAAASSGTLLGNASAQQDEALRYVADDDHATKLTHLKMAGRIFDKYLKPVSHMQMSTIHDPAHQLFFTVSGLKGILPNVQLPPADIARIAEYLRARYLTQYFTDISAHPTNRNASSGVPLPPPATERPVEAGTAEDTLPTLLTKCQYKYPTVLHVTTSLAVHFFSQRRLAHLSGRALRYALPVTVVSLRSQVWELLQMQDARSGGRLSGSPLALSEEGPLGSLMPFRPQGGLRPTRELLEIREARHPQSPDTTQIDLEGRVRFAAASDDAYHNSMRTDEAAMQYCLVDRTQDAAVSSGLPPPSVLRRARLFYTRTGVPIVCYDGNDVVCNSGLLYTGLWDEHLVGLMQHGLFKMRDEVRLAATILREREGGNSSPNRDVEEQLLGLTKGAPVTAWGDNATARAGLVELHSKRLQEARTAFAESKQAALDVLRSFSKELQMSVTTMSGGASSNVSAADLPPLAPFETVLRPRWSRGGTSPVSVYGVSGGRFGQHPSMLEVVGTSTPPIQQEEVAAAEWLLGSLSHNTLPQPKPEGATSPGPRLPVVPSVAYSLASLNHTLLSGNGTTHRRALQEWVVATLIASVDALTTDSDALGSGVPAFEPVPPTKAPTAVAIPILRSPTLVGQLSAHLVAALHHQADARRRRHALDFARLFVLPNADFGVKHASVLADLPVVGGRSYPELADRAIATEFMSEAPVSALEQLHAKSLKVSSVGRTFHRLLSTVASLASTIVDDAIVTGSDGAPLQGAVVEGRKHEASASLFETLSSTSSSSVSQAAVSSQTYDSDVALLDVGANIGVFSYFLRQQAHVDTYQFEALPSNAFLEASSYCMSTVRVHALWQNSVMALLSASETFNFKEGGAKEARLSLTFSSSTEELPPASSLRSRMRILSQQDFKVTVATSPNNGIHLGELAELLGTVSYCREQSPTTIVCVPSFERESKIFNIALGNETFEEKSSAEKRMCVLMGDEAGPADTILTCDPDEVRQAKVLWDELVIKGASPSLPATFRLFDDRPKAMVRGRLLPQEFVSLARLDALVYSGGTKYPGALLPKGNPMVAPSGGAGGHRSEPFVHMTSAPVTAQIASDHSELIDLAMRALYTNPGSNTTDVPDSVLNLAMIHRFKGLIQTLSSQGSEAPLPPGTPFHVSRFQTTRDLLRFVCIRHYVIKVDVEGFEPMVLAGTHKLLENPLLRPPVVVSEVWNSAASREVCRRMVRSPEDGGYGYIGMTVEPNMALFTILNESDVDKVVSKRYLDVDLNTILWVQRGFEHLYPTLLDGSPPNDADMPLR